MLNFFYLDGVLEHSARKRRHGRSRADSAEVLGAKEMGLACCLPYTLPWSAAKP